MKKTVCISGRVMLPIKEGARAVISCGGGFVYTSRVVEIFEVSEDMVHFETMNSIYKVSLVPNPVTAVISDAYAKCA
ncbi:MAG: hypothetical protein IJ011_00310 [Clostridia bacterium]|nr:hypothetical protein [Clostridia bacterium]